MLYYTHLAFGFLFGLLYMKGFFVGNQILFIFLVLFGSLLPDIDNPKSKVGRNAPLIGWFFEHRGIFHSVFPLILLVCLTFVTNWDWFLVPVSVGYGSHLFIDLFTKKGLRIFYPFKTNVRGFITTGSWFEKLLFLVLLIVDFVLVRGWF